MCLSPTVSHRNTYCLISLVLHAATTRPPQARLPARHVPPTVEQAGSARAAVAVRTGRARHALITVAVAGTGQAAQDLALAHAPTVVHAALATSEQAAAISVKAPALPVPLGELLCTCVCKCVSACDGIHLDDHATHASSLALTTASTRRPRPPRPAPHAAVAPLASFAITVLAVAPARAQLARVAALASTGRAALASARARAPAAPTTALLDSTVCSAHT